MNGVGNAGESPRYEWKAVTVHVATRVVPRESIALVSFFRDEGFFYWIKVISEYLGGEKHDSNGCEDIGTDN